MIYRHKIITIPYLLILIYPLLQAPITPTNKRPWLYKVSKKILDYSLKQYLVEYPDHNLQQISFINNFNEKFPHPTTFIFTSELDALTPDINLYARKLRSSGTVNYLLKNIRALFTELLTLVELSKVSKIMLKDITKSIQYYCKQ